MANIHVLITHRDINGKAPAGNSSGFVITTPCTNLLRSLNPTAKRERKRRRERERENAIVKERERERERASYRTLLIGLN